MRLSQTGLMMVAVLDLSLRYCLYNNITTIVVDNETNFQHCGGFFVSISNGDI